MAVTARGTTAASQFQGKGRAQCAWRPIAGAPGTVVSGVGPPRYSEGGGVDLRPGGWVTGQGRDVPGWCTGRDGRRADHRPKWP